MRSLSVNTNLNANGVSLGSSSTVRRCRIRDTPSAATRPSRSALAGLTKAQRRDRFIRARAAARGAVETLVDLYYWRDVLEQDQVDGTNVARSANPEHDLRETKNAIRMCELLRNQAQLELQDLQTFFIDDVVMWEKEIAEKKVTE
jgi:hypothetical protein